jgi:hypothetical protein
MAAPGDMTTFALVPEPGLGIGPRRIPATSPTTVHASVVNLAGANSLRVVLRGSRDGVNWKQKEKRKKNKIGTKKK